MSSRPETTVKTPKGKSEKTAKERSFLFEKNSIFAASVKTCKCKETFATHCFSKTHDGDTSKNAPPCGNVAYKDGRCRRFNCGCYFAEWREGTSSGNADKEREYSVTGGLVTA